MMQSPEHCSSSSLGNISSGENGSPRKYTAQETIQIYTDWANHYLEKSKSKRHIQDLQVDVTDGVVLADVIESVTTIKVPDINRKPKSASQMLDNIQACLHFLTNLGVCLEGINSRDIRDGHLKSILSLFFQLSRFKQQQKQQDRDRHNLAREANNFIMQATIKGKEGSRLPSAYIPKPSTDRTNIPLPSSAGQPPPGLVIASSPYATTATNSLPGNRKLSLEKGKVILSSQQHIYSSPAGHVPVVGKPASGSSSRSTSPSASHSFIPTPRSGIPGQRAQENKSGPNHSQKVPGGVKTRAVNSASIHTSNVSTAVNTPQAKGSMLEKFKFFKDKGEKPKVSTGSKRTSSSSGFSSARSERSDSSVSISSDSNKPLSSEPPYYPENQGSQNGSIIPQSSVLGPGSPLHSETSTPRLAIKGLGKKLGKAISKDSSGKGSSQSPKVGRKEDAPKTSSSSNNKKPEIPAQGINKSAGKGGTSKASNGTPSEPTPPPPSFLRPPKTGDRGSQNRDSRSRFSGTGIPTRNSLLIGSQNGDDSIHSSMTSITGIPKPTAAVKGTSKSSGPLGSKEALKGQEASKGGQEGGGQQKPLKKLLKQEVSVALVAPMPSLSNSTSVSSVDSNSVSQISTISQSESEASVILRVQPKAPAINHNNTKQQQKEGAEEKQGSPIREDSNRKKEEEEEAEKELIMEDTSGNSNKMSPMSVFGDSGSSSMGSLKAVESNSSASSGADYRERQFSPNNGNNEVIQEAEEDELLLNVTPMEPLNYEYIKSPPGGPPPSFLGVKGGRLGGALNGNRRGFNPYGDPARLGLSRKEDGGSGLENEYSEIDNFDINSAGYLSDGDILSGSNGNHSNHRGSSDGYLSESGTSIYRRSEGYGGGRKDGNQNNNKHQLQSLIPEDSFDDSSSISSGISDLNEIPTDLTSSSVNSELSSPYASLQRGESAVNSADANKTDLEGRKELEPGTLIYRVVGSRNKATREGVKSTSCPKTSSAQYLKGPKYGSGCNGTQRSLNSLDLKGKNKGMIGVKEDYYSNSPMGDRLMREENKACPSPSLDERRRMGQQSSNFCVRRSTGCGVGTSSQVSSTKYSIPLYPAGNGKVALSGMKDILTPEEFKAAHAALAMAAQGSYHHQQQQQGYPCQPAPPTPKGRTKVKVSGGTQTTSDLLHQDGRHSALSYIPPESEYSGGTMSISSRNSANFGRSFDQYKSLSLTGPAASQLSQNLRERILGGSQSLPKGATSADYAALLAAIQQQQQVYGTPNASKERMSRYMGSGSGYGEGGYSWIRHSTGAGYAGSVTSAPPCSRMGGGLAEAESMESIGSSAMHSGQGQGGGLRGVQREASPAQSPRLNRSNSISSHFRERTFPRSTKSEKMYPSMLQRNGEEGPYYNSNSTDGIPLSPNQGQGVTRLTGPLSESPYGTTNANYQNVRLSMSPYTTGFLTRNPTKDDEINASSLSLVSTSSMYSSQEDKQAHEVRKLRRELMEAQEKVQTLTNQLSTNAHVVAAFEQSLSNMTQRIQSLTSSAEQKDSELLELKHTIELLRKQSIEAGLTVASMRAGMSRDGSPIARQLSADSVSSINSISSACSCNSHSHTSSPSGVGVGGTPGGTPTHGPSTIPTPDSPGLKKKGGGGWLRSSFTKAFSRSKGKGHGGRVAEEGEEDPVFRRPSELTGTNGSGHGEHHGHRNHCAKHVTSPLLSPPQSQACSSSSGSHSPRSAATGGEEFGEDGKSVDELKKALREKEMVLTDIRLEALTSAHQLESLKETVNKMRNEMLSLKQDNERLQRMVTSKSLNSSQSSLQMPSMVGEGMERRLSASEVPPPSAANLEAMMCDGSEKEGKRIVVTVYLGCHGSYERFSSHSPEGFPPQECSIGSVSVSNKTKWDVLDVMVRRAFRDYLARVDPVSSLGLSPDSILCYNVGEVLRSKEGPLPELLPCGYLVGDVTKIRVCLKGASQSCLDALAFETLIPKAILTRYISLLEDHSRLIFCGPSGTGKSYLARKVGEYLVARAGKEPSPEAIASFSADHKNAKELKHLLANLAEQAEFGGELPSVIILDNLHQVSSFGEVFSSYLQNSRGGTGGPFIIGTMTQSAASTTNLQVHQNFRWVLFGNHLEPVKGLLSRYLQRRLVESDVAAGSKNLELARVFDWIPKVWLHVNKVLEIHNSSEVTIGPRLFLSCPTDVANSQAWFTDLWHYSLVPYMIEAVKEGLQLYGKKAGWEDPALFLLHTYPWTEGRGKASILRLRPEDVGYDVKAELGSPAKGGGRGESGEQDPLMNMLLRLQEAANYSGPQSSESESTSLNSRTSLDKDFIATA